MSKDIENIDINQAVEEYDSLREEIKGKKERKKELGKKIKKFAERFAEKDEKGNYYLSNDKFTFGKQARTSTGLDREQAERILKRLNLWEKATVVKREVSEDKLEELKNEGELDARDIEDMKYENVRYYTHVKENKDKSQGKGVHVKELDKSLGVSGESGSIILDKNGNKV